MVKLDELSIPDDEIPNKSVIFLYDDRIKMYLYAGNFSGHVAQVGYMEVQNVMFDDRRKIRKHVIRDHESMLEQLQLGVDILIGSEPRSQKTLDLVTRTTVQTILWCYGFELDEIHKMMNNVLIYPYPFNLMLKHLAEVNRERLGKPHCWGEPNEECSDCEYLKECMDFFKEKINHDEKKDILS